MDKREYQSVWGGFLESINSMDEELNRTVTPMMLQADFIDSIGKVPDTTSEDFYNEILAQKAINEKCICILDAYRGASA